jgi:tetratricopeptide (TPR) repeat protein
MSISPMTFDKQTRHSSVANMRSRLADIRELGATDPTAALASARALLHERVSEPDVLALVAECHLEVGDAKAAQRYAKRALAVRPGNGPANLVLGKLYVKRNRLRKAIQYLRKALRSPYSRSEAHKEISKPLFELARSTPEYREARNHLRLYLRHHPENADAWMDLAWECYYCGRWDECDEICEKVKALDPKSARPFIMEGWSRHMQGRYADAMTCFRSAVDVDPRSAQAYERLGLLREVLNDYVGAVECLLFSLQLDINRPRSWDMLLNVLGGAVQQWLFPSSESAVMPDLIQRICESALVHACDDSTNAIMLRYHIYERLGNQEASIAEGQKYVKLFPDTKVAEMMRGVLRSRAIPGQDDEEDEVGQQFLSTFGHLLPSAPIESNEAQEIERLWELFQAGKLPKPGV